MKTPIIQFKNFFIENLLLTVVDFSISENETLWKLQNDN